ncbi:MAG: sensor histidine kinase [Gemmataceae bacterium]
MRTLRFRLTLWNALVVLLVVGGTLLGVHEGLRLIMIHEVDKLLEQDLLEIKLALEQSHPNLSASEEEIERMALSHTQRGLFVQLFRSGGPPLWSSTNTPVSVAQTGLQKLGRPFFVGELRVLQRNVVLPDKQALTVRVGSSWDFGATDFQTLTWLMLGMLVLVLFIAPLGGYLLASWTTGALARIIDTTARLKPSKLDERLEIRGSGDELDQLSITINAFLDRLAGYLDINRRFTADAAHELRSPLAAMQSALEVALNAERSSEEYKELIVELLEECERLRRLANQLLLLAESDVHRLLPVAEPVPLDQVVRRAVDMFQGVAESAGVELAANIAAPMIIHGDRGRLRQVVDNLIDNAIKFTPAGGNVQVDLVRDRAADQAVLTIRDTGVGIDPKDLKRIFERFWQADRARTARGAGLGLSICQAIVASHGGTIDASSEVGCGTTLEVRLPAAAAGQVPTRRVSEGSSA